MLAARLSAIAFVSVLVSSQVASAEDDCKCLAIAGDLSGALQVEVARADSLYMRGDFSGAFNIYARAYAEGRASALLFAQGLAKWRMGDNEDARRWFDAYLKVEGQIAYRARAEVYLRQLGGPLPTVGGAVGGVVGGGLGLTNKVGGTLGIDGVTRPVTGTVGGVTGEVTGRLDGDIKPPKVAKGAAIVLGVVAIAAVGAVSIHMIAAGIKDDISLDAKFDAGLGLSGVTVGITAIYLYGLTAATGTVGAAGGLRCETPPAKNTHRPIIAPIALPGGGGIATAMTF